MDGLECSEIQKGQLEYSGRLDAEYYQKKYLYYQSLVEQCLNSPLGKIADFLIGPFGSSYNTENYIAKPDYRYVRGQDVRPFMLRSDSARYMAEEDFQRLKKYALKENDILVSVVGTLGNACIVQAKDLPGIFSCKSTVIRAKHINPYFLLAYLNSKLGQNLLLRKERGAIQKGLNLEDLKSILVPLFRNGIDYEVEFVLRCALEKLEQSQRIYNGAEYSLLDYLGDISHETTALITSIRQYSESFFVSGRLDAEYYQPKYDEYWSTIKNYKNGYSKIGQEFTHVKEKCNRNLPAYSYVEIGDIDVGTGSAVYNCINTADLPDNAKILTQKDDILVSTVRPNRGAVAILDGNNFLVSGAFTVLRERTGYKKEVLQVLLRSPMYRDWLLQYNVGTSYPVIRDSDVLNMPIPLLEGGVQESIADKVKESTALRQQSKCLFEYAKQAVEMAIEQGEDVAMAWLKEKGGGK